MVAHFSMRTYGLDQAFVDLLKAFGYIERIVKFLCRKRHILHHTCVTCSEPPSNISTMPNSRSRREGRPQIFQSGTQIPVLRIRLGPDPTPLQKKPGSGT